MSTKLWFILTTFWLTGCMDNYLPADPNLEYKSCVERAQTIFERCEGLIPACGGSLDIHCVNQYNNDVRSCK